MAQGRRHGWTIHWTIRRASRVVVVVVMLAGCAMPGDGLVLGGARAAAAGAAAATATAATTVDAEAGMSDATAFAMPPDYAQRLAEASQRAPDPALPAIPGVRWDTFAGHRVVRVSTPHAEAAVALFGGHVVSFVPAGAGDVLWMSPASRPAPAAIRGGIPVIWPYFGREGQTADVPAHGLVRTLRWDLLDVAREADGSIVIAMAPPPLEGVPLRLRMEVRVGRTLEQRLTTRNTGPATVAFSQALHNYLRVGHAGEVTVSGVAGLAYLDKNDDYRVRRQAADWRLSDAPDPGRSDRIYSGGAGAYALLDPDARRRIALTVEGANGLVIWNPGAAGAARAADLHPRDWRDFVCVEPANTGTGRVVLAPGASHTLVQRLEVLPLGETEHRGERGPGRAPP